MLRVIGNCCIDDEASRELVAQHLGKFAKGLKCNENFEVTVGALWNLYKGDVAPPDAALELEIIDEVAKGMVYGEGAAMIEADNPNASAAISLLASVVISTVETGVFQTSASRLLIECMIRLATNTDFRPDLDSDLDNEDNDEDDDEVDDEVDEGVLMLQATLGILKEEEIQHKVAGFHVALLDKVGDTVDPKKLNEVHLSDPFTSALLLYEKLVCDSTPSPEEDNLKLASFYKLAKVKLDHLQNSLSEIAYFLKYTTPDEFLQDHAIYAMDRWLKTPTNEVWQSQHLKTCAFLVLGNIARSEDICVAMVTKLGFDIQSCQFINESRGMEPSAIHAAAGFLRNLATAKSNKPVIRDSMVVRKLVSNGTSQTLTAGLRILRQLARDEPATCKILLRLAKEADILGPADYLGISMEKITLFLPYLDPGKPNENAEAKLEIGRLVVTVLRSLQLDPTSPNPDSWMNQTLTACVLNLIQKAPGTILASDGWLGLALSSRNEEGATLVYQALRTEEPPFNSFNKTFKSRAETESQTEVFKDVENALVVVSQLVKNLVHVFLSSCMFYR